MKSKLANIWSSLKPRRSYHGPGEQLRVVAVAICTLWDCAVEILSFGFFTSDARGAALFDWFNQDNG